MRRRLRVDIGRFDGRLERVDPYVCRRRLVVPFAERRCRLMAQPRHPSFPQPLRMRVIDRRRSLAGRVESRLECVEFPFGPPQDCIDEFCLAGVSLCLVRRRFEKEELIEAELENIRDDRLRGLIG